MTVPFTVKKLLTLLDDVSPFHQAAAWDNVGLLVGEADREVQGILLALDPTEALLEEARRLHCNTIITHHPLIFHPLKSIRPDLPHGRLPGLALQHQLNIIACHTNLDVISGGVSDLLARRLGVLDPAPLEATGPAPTTYSAPNPEAPKSLPVTGFGRYGRLKTPVSGRQLLTELARLLELPALRVAGPIPATVGTVAVCGGSGSDLAEAAAARGAEIYISAEIKHATARWAELAGLCVVDAGHFHTENLMTAELAAILKPRLAAAGADHLPLRISGTQQSPFTVFCFPAAPVPPVIIQ